MPNPETPAPEAPPPADQVGNGTLLWNLQTQRPEYTPLDQVESRVNAGTHRVYSGSQVTGVGPGGVEAGLSPEEANVQTAAGHQLVSPAYHQAEARARAQREAYDTSGNKALAFADGVVKTATGGILQGVPGQKDENRELNQEENAGWQTFGEITTLVATLANPGSAIAEATPLGFANKVAGRVAEGLKGAGGVIRTAGAEAAAGAVASGILASGQQIGNLAQGRPASGHAVLDEIGLGTVLGGGLGLAGGALAKAAGSIRESRTAISAAGRFEETVMPVREAMNDAGRSWENAHDRASNSLAAIEDLTKSGALDGQLPSDEWLAARREAGAGADAAKKRLLKVAKVETIQDAVTKANEALGSKKVKDLNVIQALDEYGTAVSKFDASMHHNEVDTNHLFDVSGQTDFDALGEPNILASEHPHQDFERRLAQDPNYEHPDLGREQGRPATESSSSKTGAQKAKGTPRDMSEAGVPQGVPTMMTRDMRGKLANLGYSPGEVSELTPSDAWDIISKGESKGGKSAPSSPELSRGWRDDPSVRQTSGLPVGLNSKGDVLHEALSGAEAEAAVPRQDDLFQEVLAERKAKVAEADRGVIEAGQRPTKPIKLELAEETAPAIGKQPRGRDTSIPLDVSPVGSKHGPYEATEGADFRRPGDMYRPDEAAFKAHQILNRAQDFPAPVQVTELGGKIQSALDVLQAAHGNKLGSPELHVFAKGLGVDHAKFGGAFASKLVDVWAMRRLADGLAEAKTGAGVAGKALRAGITGMAGKAGFGVAGAFGAGVSRSVVSGAVGHVMGAVGGVVAAAGKMRQSAILGLSRVLSPVGRRAITLGAVSHVISEGYGGEPTTDWQVKADRLRALAANPDKIRERALKAMGDLHTMDPITASAAAQVAVDRVTNLAKALPVNQVVSGTASLFHKGPPAGADLANWHVYEALTADHDLIFNYVRTGFVPPTAVDAMNEQHPEYMREVREYVMNHPDEVQAASHATKMGLSSLLGINLVPEADPAYVARHQEIHALRKQEQEQKKSQGAGSIKAGLDQLPGQMMAALPQGM